MTPVGFELRETSEVKSRNRGQIPFGQVLTKGETLSLPTCVDCIVTVDEADSWSRFKTGIPTDLGVIDTTGSTKSA